MTHREKLDHDKALSRRTLVQALAAGAGAMVAGTGTAAAQPAPVAPPSTITNPPRDFGPSGAPTTYFTDPDIIAVDPSFNGLAQPNAPIQRLWTGALWAEGPAWSAQGRYLVWSDIPNNRQMRWLEDDGRVTRVPQPVEQQQRQHVRLPGPAALLRAPHAPRRALRARRLDHGDRRRVQRQAAQLAERRRRRIPTAATGSPIRPMAASSTKATPDAAGGPSNAAGPAQSAHRPAGRASARSSASCRPTATASTRAGASTSSSPRSRCPIPNGLALLARLQEALRRQHRQGSGRHRRRAARATSTSSTSAPTTSCRTRSCSATSWSTA